MYDMLFLHLFISDMCTFMAVPFEPRMKLSKVKYSEFYNHPSHRDVWPLDHLWEYLIEFIFKEIFI